MLMLNLKQLNLRLKDNVYLTAIIIILLISFIWFFKATAGIKPWPTDSYFFYRPAAKRVLSLNYISDIHKYIQGSYFRVLLHGKEALIWAYAIMQRILNDTETIFPNIVVLLIANHVSALLIFLIARKLFNRNLALLSFCLFFTCFWPHMYALQGAHPPLAMMFLLASIYCMLCAPHAKLLLMLAGMCFGFIFFSSPTAPIYLPYYLFFWILLKKEKMLHPSNTLTERLRTYLLFSSGALTIILIFTLPHPIKNIGEYFQFVSCNQYANHFFILHDRLRQYLPAGHPLLTSQSLLFRGAGWPWIIKYAWHIMPVLFGVYLGSIIFLIFRCRKILYVYGLIVLSLATPLCVEISGAAQFGRNYFSWIIGIIFLIIYALSTFRQHLPPSRHKRLPILFLSLFVLAHMGWNGWLFFSDVFPTRMAMAKVNQFLDNNGIEDILIHYQHPAQQNTTSLLHKHPFRKKIRFWWFTYITEVPPAGHIFIPPMQGFHNCVDNEFVDDPYLTELFESGEIEKYAVAIFPTIASSKIWIHEEEICTYRSLILGQLPPQDRRKGLAYILNARKLQQEWFNCRSPYKHSQLYCH